MEGAERREEGRDSHWDYYPSSETMFDNTSSSPSPLLFSPSPSPLPVYMNSPETPDPFSFGNIDAGVCTGNFDFTNQNHYLTGSVGSTSETLPSRIISSEVNGFFYGRGWSQRIIWSVTYYSTNYSLPLFSDLELESRALLQLHKCIRGMFESVFYYFQENLHDLPKKIVLFFQQSSRKHSQYETSTLMLSVQYLCTISGSRKDELSDLQNRDVAIPDFLETTLNVIPGLMKGFGIIPLKFKLKNLETLPRKGDEPLQVVFKYATDNCNSDGYESNNRALCITQNQEAGLGCENLSGDVHYGGKSERCKRLKVRREQVLDCARKNMTLLDAAKSCEMSDNTFKKLLKDFGYRQGWSALKKTMIPLSNSSNTGKGKRKVNDQEQNRQFLIASEHSASCAIQTDACDSFNVKANYKDVNIEFDFPATGDLAQLMVKVGKELSLDPGRFKIKYRDDDEDDEQFAFLTITSDDSLKYMVKSMRSKCKNVKLFVCDTS